MGPQLARVGDMCTGICTAHPTPRPFTAVLATGSPTVKADGSPVTRVGDIGYTDCGHTVQIVTGSGRVKANGVPVARVGDIVVVIEGGDGVIITGSPTTKSE